MDLERLKKHLIYKFTSEKELVQAIDKISTNFTQSRENIGDYVKDPKMVAAYTCFYLTTNYSKLRVCLAKSQINIGDYKDCEFIDIGTGPGTFTCALLDLVDGAQVIALETSDLMGQQAQRIVSGLYGRTDYRVYSNVKKVPSKKRNRFGVFGHSANEMSLKTILNIIDSLELDHILFLEPGTQDYFKKSLEVRTKLMESYHINYPCPSSGNCPMSTPDWCHQYIKVSHDPGVERLTQLVKKNRRLLPMTIHFYSKNKREANISNMITRVYKPTKFSSLWLMCRKKDDSENELIDVEIMNKGLAKSEIKEMKNIMSGDSFEIEINKEISHHSFRGKIVCD